jgi:hypothetical protein
MKLKRKERKTSKRKSFFCLIYFNLHNEQERERAF